MIKIKFNRVDDAWTMTITTETGEELRKIVFREDVTDNDIISMAITLGKGDIVNTSVDFTGA